ncbi:MAG: hypothetical protein JSW71_05730 [Gemmatimonadota bacterium]|nr:MAG: hypothetical protein JSW71_05730 [Gemmatimonadota bacterium]
MSRGRSWGRLRGWALWDEKLERWGDAAKRPGVYLLAHFKGTPPREMDTTDKRIIYIGETCAKGGLRSRWVKFAQAAFRGKRGHSGGDTYWKLFHGKHRDRLYVAFATPRDDEVVLPFRIKFLERKWILDYVLTHGHPPCCNSE